MANKNPDFTQIGLGDHPACSYEEWKKNLEAAAGDKYDALYDTTLERIPVKPLYTHEEYDTCHHLDFVAGIPPFLRGPMRPCMSSAPGQSVSMPDSPQQKNPMHSTAGTWLPVRKVCPLHLTCRRTAL